MTINEEELLEFISKETNGKHSKEDINAILDAEMEFLIKKGIAEVD